MRRMGWKGKEFRNKDGDDKLRTQNGWMEMGCTG